MNNSKNIRLIGIIQCDFAKERCSGFACINSFNERIDAFERYQAVDGIMAVPFNCGGCPGRRIGRNVSHLVKKAKQKAGIEKDEIAIHLSSCMVTDNAHYPPCPHLDYIGQILDRKGVKVVKGSYKSFTTENRRGKGEYMPFDWSEE